MIDTTGLREDKRPQSSTIVHALLDRLEAAEKERDGLRESEKWYRRRCDLLQEQQSKMRDPERTIVCDILANGALLHADFAGDRYTIPGAQTQPAPSVPDDVMRDAERYRYLRARDDGTAGVGCWIEADGRVCDRGWLYGVQLDSAIDSFIEVLAAAPKPEAKP